MQTLAHWAELVPCGMVTKCPRALLAFGKAAERAPELGRERWGGHTPWCSGGEAGRDQPWAQHL